MNTISRVYIISGKSHHTYPGGLGQYSKMIAKMLSGSDLKVTVIGFGETNEITYEDGIKYLKVKVVGSKLLGLMAPVIAIQLSRRLVEEIKNNENTDGNLIIGAAIWGLAGLFANMQNKVKSKLWVSYFTSYKHEYSGHIMGAPSDIYGRYQNLKFRAIRRFVTAFVTPFENLLLRKSDKILLYYKSTHKLLVKEFGDTIGDKIVTLPYAANTPTVNLRVTENSMGLKPELLLVSRQDPRKGIGFLLSALKELDNQGIFMKCRIVGKGVFLKQHKDLVKQLGLSDRVQFYGFLDHPFSLVNANTVYVFPSVEEGSGAISLMEAMSLGLPILTSNCDGITEDITHEVNGIVFEAGNVASLAEKLKDLSENKFNLVTIRKGVKSTYEERFNFERARDAINKLVKDEKN
jgi:glycosyltransferase involved in cell wall biosynthesis